MGAEATLDETAAAGTAAWSGAPVAALAELQFDQIAEHHVLAAAQNARRHIGAKRGNEDEDRSGNDSGFDERNDDAAGNERRGMPAVHRALEHLLIPREKIPDDLPFPRRHVSVTVTVRTP